MRRSSPYFSIISVRVFANDFHHAIRVAEDQFVTGDLFGDLAVLGDELVDFETDELDQLQPTDRFSLRLAEQHGPDSEVAPSATRESWAHWG